MRYLYVCNKSSDYISKIDLNSFSEKYKISLNLRKEHNKVGPQGIYINDNKLFIANSYSNSLSIVDMKNDIELENHFIGMHCNDIVVNNNNAYIICGDLNNVVVFDLLSKRIVEEIPCGDLPHSIVLNKEKQLLLISNMQNDTITLIDCINTRNVKTIKVGHYPTKAIFTFDGKYVIVCESNMGSDFKGSISIISLKNLRVIYKISTGNSPIDMFYDGKFCFITNLGEGTISIIDINYYKEIKKISIGGMPRGIIKIGKNIYVADTYNDLLFEINILEENKKAILIGGEPTGMAIY